MGYRIPARQISTIFRRCPRAISEIALPGCPRDEWRKRPKQCRLPSDLMRRLDSRQIALEERVRTGNAARLPTDKNEPPMVLPSTELDTLIGVAAFEHVRQLAQLHDQLTARELKPGFGFQGQRIPLVNPQRGIFKPQQMRFLLSIKTVFPRPVSYLGGSPHSPRAAWRRSAARFVRARAGRI
jgi:hypothetical protein